MVKEKNRPPVDDLRFLFLWAQLFVCNINLETPCINIQALSTLFFIVKV